MLRPAFMDQTLTRYVAVTVHKDGVTVKRAYSVLI